MSRALQSVGAVLIEGPRACGKTETARQASRSEVLLDVDQGARRAAAVDPGLVLAGQSSRLIDEWQVVPALRNQVRRAVGERGGAGHFILTGSSVPSDDETRHVGAGRFLRLRMRPTTLAESGHSPGEVSLAALLRGENLRAVDPGCAKLPSGISSTRCWPSLRLGPRRHACCRISSGLGCSSRTW
ncbi:MAG: AAA family ATPase [Deltaproteobacteria bacterium]|nr:AAA family ATPase [Deltaproteobacteria bacterium]